MEKPLVSVCIPVYNGEKYISEAVNSVLNQTYQNIELIVIDNKSTDKTVSIIKNIDTQKIRKFTLLENDSNIGFENNWNKCLEMATGKYIKILPADDIIYPDCISIQVEILKSDTTIALVSSGRHIVKDSGKIITKRNFFNKNKKINNIKAMRKMVRSGSNRMGEPGAVMFRREHSKITGKFDTSIFYVVDIDYWFRLLKLGDIYVSSKPMAAFRISLNSLSVVTQASQAKDYKMWYTKLYKSGEYGIKSYDIIIGIVISRINQYLKQLLYFLVVKKNKE